MRRKAAERLADLIDPNRALREAARLAYSDVGALFDEDGHLRPVHTLPPEVRAAIASIEIVRKNLASGNRTQEYVHKVKLWDKPTSLALLFKHLGLLVERLEHLGTLNIRWAWPTAEELDTMERQALPKALPAPVTRGDADL